MEVATERVEANGLLFSVAVFRPRARRRVLMLHGYLDQGRSMEALAAALPEDWGCVAPDWRGHGRTERAGAGASYHVQDHARDLDALWDRLQLERPIVVGHSMGGNVALLLLGSCARHAAGLVFLDILGPPGEDAAMAPERLRAALEDRRKVRTARVMPDRDAALKRLLETNARLTERGARRILEHGVVDVEGGVTWAWDPRVQGSPLFRYTEDGVLALLRGVPCPVLLVRSTAGIVQAREDHAARHDAVKQLDEVVLEDVGHHVHVDAEDRVAEAIKMWARGRGI